MTLRRADQFSIGEYEETARGGPGDGIASVVVRGVVRRQIGGAAMFGAFPQSALRMRSVRRWSLTRRLFVDPSLPQELVEALWQDNVDSLVFSAAPLQVKRRCIAARLDHPQGPLLVKRHTWGGLARTARMLLRASSARRCARRGWYLAQHGVPTPRPRACVEMCLGPFGYRSYLVTDYVEGTSLFHFVRYDSPSNEELAHVAEKVVAIFQQLYQLGVSHNDTKPENFIIDDERNVWLIDLECMRLHRRRKGLARRHMGDVFNFLHPRSWRNHEDAREIFRQAFLDGPLGQVIRGAAAENALPLLPAQPASGQDCGLSVVVLCEQETDPAQIERAAESVRDIADETLLISQSKLTGRLNVARLAGAAPAGRGNLTIHGSRYVSADTRTVPSAELTNVAGHSWILVLHENEFAAPTLVRELQRRLADPGDCDAFRILVEKSYFGHAVAASGEVADHPIRLFRRQQCSFSATGSAMAVLASPERTGRLDSTVVQEVHADIAQLVALLNEQSDRAAAERFDAGERPRLAKAALCALTRLMWASVRLNTLRSGWAGITLRFLQVAFVWVEEAKLWQITSGFNSSRHQSLPSVAAGEPTLDRRQNVLQPSDASRAKAA